MASLLRLEKVYKRYRSGAAREIVPVNGVDLELNEGGRMVLLGKSGSGKSTLLNLIGGVDVPTSGRVLFRGRDISSLTPDELAMYRRKEVGFVFQSFNLFPTLTVGENLTLPLELLGISDDKAARSLLDAVGLEDQWNKFPEQLSGGEQQRVALARALVKEPSLILADEPTGNLDHETGAEILELIHEICLSRNATLIMATHSTEALWIAQKRFKIKSGRLVEETEEKIAG